MNILLVEPDCQKKPKIKGKPDDERLWYPPLALMKFSQFHKQRGDDVTFVRGCNQNIIGNLFSNDKGFDRIYISTLFTFNYRKIIKTINFYKDAVCGSINKIYIGGIMATLMPEEIFEDTGIYPKTGLITHPSQIDMEGEENIDLIQPDYDIIDSNKYAINDTYYAYASRGCVNSCQWCGVPMLEKEFQSYIDIKQIIFSLRGKYGDKSKLKLMDNNILASHKLSKVIDDLLELGYGKDDYTTGYPKRKRIVDFNQGLDATFITEENIKLLSKLAIKPMRIAFDHISEKKAYTKALEISYKYGIRDFSNYMLFNFKDTPMDLYERLSINISFNEKWYSDNTKTNGKVYSYPMRYAPIIDKTNQGLNKRRDYINEIDYNDYDWLTNPQWTKKFIRNISVMTGTAHGAISSTSSLAWRTIGHSFEEFLINLYMPEELLRNRNKYEKKTYNNNQEPGTGMIENFREFMLHLLQNQNKRFYFFHNAVCLNTAISIKNALSNCNDMELTKWLKLYIAK